MQLRCIYESHIELVQVGQRSPLRRSYAAYDKGGKKWRVIAVVYCLGIQLQVNVVYRAFSPQNNR